MLTNEEICLSIETAVPPYRCVPEIWDYGKKLRFKVFDAAAQPIITMSEVILSTIRDVAALDALRVVIRQRVQEHIDRNKQLS